LNNRGESRDDQRDVNSALYAVRSAALAAKSNTQIGSPDVAKRHGEDAMTCETAVTSAYEASRTVPLSIIEELAVVRLPADFERARLELAAIPGDESCDAGA
jgi:hypothetical protein